ncbi:hypothetical protein [Deinococcus misasensis]|uniref:hypothetical protein n=1 Tax=Deinococcus misasensis TaxID=392413 RepID=UPI000551E8CC|nr:hypothetical protein [Deinococcus misasensis]
MAYTLHITGKNAAILQEDFLDFLAQHPEFQPMKPQLHNPKTAELLTLPDLLMVQCHGLVFALVRGKISFQPRNLEEDLRVAQALATALDARIVGDEGEEYGL